MSDPSPNQPAPEAEPRSAVDKKSAKTQAKADKKVAKAQAKAVAAHATRDAVAAGLSRARLPSGIAIDVREGDKGSELVVSGLSDVQLQTIAPHVAREVLIAVTAERSTLRAGLMRFVREGIFQTIVKVVAGLVVAWVLLRFGLGT